MNWSKTLCCAFGLAAAGAAYYGLAPEKQVLPDTYSFSPSPVQQEFLRLAAAKYDYVLLGDTNHQQAEINLFAMHKDTLGAVAAGGDKFFFIETDPQGTQSYIEDIVAGPDRVERRGMRLGDANMWICADDVRRRVSENFEESVRANPAITMVGADQRQVAENDPIKGWRNRILLGLPMDLSLMTYGCVGTNAFALSHLADRITGSDTMDMLADDRATAAALLARAPEGGTIYYGSGHFTGGANALDSLLMDAGKSVIHINIYPTNAVASRALEFSFRVPHAYLIVRHEDEDEKSQGVYTGVKEFDDLFYEAEANVTARNSLMPRP